MKMAALTFDQRGPFQFYIRYLGSDAIPENAVNDVLARDPDIRQFTITFRLKLTHGLQTHVALGCLGQRAHNGVHGLLKERRAM